MYMFATVTEEYVKHLLHKANICNKQNILEKNVQNSEKVT